jgi:hypothetical protein
MTPVVFLPIAAFHSTVEFSDRLFPQSLIDPLQFLLNRTPTAGAVRQILAARQRIDRCFKYERFQAIAVS